MVHTGICDDNQIELKVNEVYIKELSNELKCNISIHSFSSGNQIIEYAKKNPLEIAFLDIDMEELNGIQTAVKLKEINKQIVIIFLTGHREYALDAFDVDAIAYIVKPIELNKLKRCFIKAINQSNQEKRKIISSTLIITEDNLKKKIMQSKILYMEKQKNQCIIYTTEGVHYVYETISSLIMKLDEYFWQINQGLIVNMKYIERIEKNDVYLKNGTVHSLGRKFVKTIKEKFFI